MIQILTFIPLLYIFAAFPAIRRRHVGDGDGVIRAVPGGAAGCWLVCAAGFAVTLLAPITSFTPPLHDHHSGLFFPDVGGGCCLMIVIGLIFYQRGLRMLRAAPVPPGVVGEP